VSFDFFWIFPAFSPLFWLSALLPSLFSMLSLKAISCSFALIATVLTLIPSVIGDGPARVITDACPVYAPFFGALGAASAMIFCVFGSALGTAQAGVGISAVGVMKPDFIMKALVPVIFAAAIGIYGLIVALIILSNLKAGDGYSLYSGFLDMGGGMSCGLSGLAAGMSIGKVGDAGVRAAAQQSRMYIGLVLILIFAEALALFGMIAGIVFSVQGNCTTAPSPSPSM